jgi:hypothetical protein
MSITPVPAPADRTNLKIFFGRFATDLGAAVHSAMMLIGEKLGLYKAIAEGPAELSRVGTTGADVALCMGTGTHSDAPTTANHVTGWRKRRQLFVPRQRWIAAAVLSCVLIAPSRSYSGRTPDYHEGAVAELSALGKRGDTIVRAREQVLQILQDGNACSAWFREADPDPAEVFRSVHFQLERNGTSAIYSMRNSHGTQLFKQPWGARSIEFAGRGSTIRLNANGAFFNRTSPVIQQDSGPMVVWVSGNRALTISSYSGDTPEAQITILLHELGHITGRLPEDDDSWDGQSSRNTSEVLRHCKSETRAAAHKSLRGSI